MLMKVYPFALLAFSAHALEHLMDSRMMRLESKMGTAMVAWNGLARQDQIVAPPHDDGNDGFPPAIWFPLRPDVLIENPSCGFTTDCPLDYKIADVNEMAKRQQVANAADAKKLQKIHDQALAACHDANSINEHGGWCYRPGNLVKAGKDSDIDYNLPPNHVQADAGFVSFLAKNVLLKDDGSCCASLTDFGAGVGQFGHALRALLPNLEYHGYDGAGNVEEFTHNYVHFVDLTQPLHLKRTDWVISSEVGEHIPHVFEKQVIANLHAHNCKGVILTWAVLGQGGHGHINCHSNEYLIHIFQELGYTMNQTMTQAMRNSVTSSGWLHGSAMAFERTTKPAECIHSM